MTPNRRVSPLTILSLLFVAAIVASLWLPYRAGDRIADVEDATIDALVAVHRKQEAMRQASDGRPGYFPALAAAGALDGTLQGGDLIREGYRFRIFLANAEGEGVRHEKAVRRPGSVGPPCVCYAWPVEWATTGRRAFALLDDGTVLSTENAERRYGGDRAPRPGAAFRASQADRIIDPPAARFEKPRDWGSDGQVWTIVDLATRENRR